MRSFVPTMPSIQKLIILRSYLLLRQTRLSSYDFAADFIHLVIFLFRLIFIVVGFLGGFEDLFLKNLYFSFGLFLSLYWLYDLVSLDEFIFLRRKLSLYFWKELFVVRWVSYSKKIVTVKWPNRFVLRAYLNLVLTISFLITWSWIRYKYILVIFFELGLNLDNSFVLLWCLGM